MTSALILAHGVKGVPALVADLQSAGIQVLGLTADYGKLLPDVVRHAPDVVICDDQNPGDALFKATLAIAQTAACPVIVFTKDGDAGQIARAIQSGVHAYVVNGYGADRLRSLVHLAQARFRHEHALQSALQDLSTRFEERRLVDRAKGILMRVHQLSDDDAFRILRTASMHSNQRLGQVSQSVIQSARFAEDVNRCGQLRMLSQRLCKLCLLQLAGVEDGRFSTQFLESIQRVDANLAHLEKSLSQATYGDLLGQVEQSWSHLKQVLQSAREGAPVDSAYARTDELAEQLLRGAERLTANLERTGMAPPLRVLNLAGRQRMLSQRFAKYAVLGMLGDAQLVARSDAGMAESKAAFEQALTYLNGIPLSTPEIRQALEAAGIGWLQLLAVIKEARQAAPLARRELLKRMAIASEDLLDVFERLSDHYERSMQTLAGD